MKIVCISDTHEQHGSLSLPEGDILIHAGDSTSHGDLLRFQMFVEWMNWLPYEHKVLVAGNHDSNFIWEPTATRRILATIGPAITYLQDEAAEIGGLRFYGSPWTTLDRQLSLAHIFGAIPVDTEVLVTHTPPYGTLDLPPKGLRLGSEDLAMRIPELASLRLHVFGHIHHSYGRRDDPETGLVSVNAAICTEAYRATREAIVVELEN